MRSSVGYIRLNVSCVVCVVYGILDSGSAM